MACLPVKGNYLIVIQCNRVPIVKKNHFFPFGRNQMTVMSFLTTIYSLNLQGNAIKREECGIMSVMWTIDALYLPKYS